MLPALCLLFISRGSSSSFRSPSRYVCLNLLLTVVVRIFFLLFSASCVCSNSEPILLLRLLGLATHKSCRGCLVVFPPMSLGLLSGDSCFWLTQLPSTKGDLKMYVSIRPSI